MTFNTRNPIGSTDARDRLDNSENMDILENSTTLTAHADRLGTMRKTRKGMELEHDNQIAAHESEHDSQIAAHEVEHDNQMLSFESDFDSRLAGMAFTRVSTFTTGATLTDMRQTLLWEVSQGGDGHEYGWAGSFAPDGKVVTAGSTPETTGGVGAGAWVDRTDVTLRDEIRETVFQNMKRSYAEAGYNLVVGSFEAGGTLASVSDVLLHEASGKAYGWGGVFPKVVTAGYGVAGFIDKSGEILRPFVLSEITRLSKRTMIDAREFGLSTSAMNDPSLLLSAISECNELGSTLGVSGVLDFGDAEIEVMSLCNIFGSGGFKNLRFVINQDGDAFKQINGISIETQAVGGDHGFVLKRGRFIDFLNIRAKGVEAVINGETDSGTGFHSIGLITIDNMSALNVGRLVHLQHNSADPLAYNDFKFTNNRGWFTRYGGFYAEQLDGLIYSDNLMHSGRNTSEHTNHLYVSNGEWLNIAGSNTFFEGGREAILLKDVGTASICGSNRIAFCGQQAPSSGVKVLNTRADKFLNLNVASNSVAVEKPTLHGLEVVTQGGLLNVGVISANIDVRVGSGAGMTYFGSTPLDSVAHNGVNINGGQVNGPAQSSGLFINSGGVSSRLIDTSNPSSERTNIARLDNKSASSSFTTTKAVGSGVATTIVGPIAFETGTASVSAGSITVQVYSSDGLKVGVYELLYRRSSAASADVSVTGFLHDPTIVANTPAFNWQVSGSGGLQVFPKSLTAGGGFVSGTFTFVFSATGNISFSLK